MGERMALNAPIQGSAADIIKMAMIELDRHLRSEGSGAEMVLQVHDELVIEVTEAEIAPVTAATVEIMRSVVDLRVPLEVATGAGVNLAEAHH
jgi:DNA polymerase-1